MSYGAGEFKEHYNKGIELYKQGKYDQAGSEFEKAIELKPTDVYAIYGLGNTYYCLTKYDDAVKVYSKAIKINPDYAKVHYSLSLAYSKLGKTQEAENHKAIFRKLSKGGKVSESSGTQARSSHTMRYKGTDYSPKKFLATAPKKSLATAPRKSLDSAEKKSLPNKEIVDTHSTHDSGHQEKTVYERHNAQATSRTKKDDDSGSIFKGYSDETHKADKRVFTKKHHRVSGTTKNPFSNIKYFIQDKWDVSGLHRIWICAAGYIFATQIWLCIVSFLCLIVWRIRENS